MGPEATMVYWRSPDLDRPVRRGGRVELEYRGHGPAADSLAELDVAARDPRLAALADYRVAGGPMGPRVAALVLN
jgi:hypothetical protein